MFRILVSDRLDAAGLELLEQAADVAYDMKTGLSQEELLAIIPEYDGMIIRSGTKANAAVLAAGKRLKVVGRAGIGVDNIDIPAATAQGIVVMNTPGSNSVATAEQTMALMLAVSRHTVPAHNSLATGEWNRAQLAGTELYGKVLGIVGLGRIGRLLAERSRALGMTVSAATLIEGHVKAAALDVFASEPPAGNPLINLPNVLHTPHLGASTAEAQRNVATQIVEQVIDCLRGVETRNIVPHFFALCVPVVLTRYSHSWVGFLRGQWSHLLRRFSSMMLL